VAQRWATAEPPPKEGNTLAEQCKGLGIPETAFEADIKEEEARQSPVEVWEENWPAVAVFLGCSTQWRLLMPPMGGTLIHEGLIYSGVRDVIWAHGHDGDAARALFADVQLMEASALKELRELANRKSS